MATAEKITLRSKATDSRLKLANSCRNHYLLVPVDGTTVEDLRSQEYWQHVARRIKMGDRIDVVWEDGSGLVELYVVGSGAQWVNVKVLHEYTFDPVKIEDQENYAVEFKGPVHKWRVVRKSDNVVLKAGISSKTEAEQYKLNHIRATA